MLKTWIDRRDFVAAISRFGLASIVFPAVLYEMAEARREISKEMISDAAAVAGLEFDSAQQEMMLDDLRSRLKAYDAIHDLRLPNQVPPALVFDPVLPGMSYQHPRRAPRYTRPAGTRPAATFGFGACDVCAPDPSG